MTMVETCKSCKFRKRCNGRVSKNSAYCEKLRSGNKAEKTLGWFMKMNRGLDKTATYLKYFQNKDK